MSFFGLFNASVPDQESTEEERDVKKEAREADPAANPPSINEEEGRERQAGAVESCPSVEMTAEDFSKSFEKEEEKETTARDDQPTRDQPESNESHAQGTKYIPPIIEESSTEESVAMALMAKVDINHSIPSQEEEREIGEKSTDETEPEDDDEEEIDMVFVEQFDNAFNEFISYNQKFIMANPDLVHSMRVTKLQALLAYQDEVEQELLEELEEATQSKTEMEASYQEQLRNASRKKAAHDISLRGKLKEVNKATREMEASMTWELINKSQAFAENRQMALEAYKLKPAKVMDRSCLMELLPKNSSCQAVRDAVYAPSSSGPLTKEQEQAVQQMKIDNALLSGEVATLKKKLEYQKKAAAAQGWVDSVLVRMDKKSMKKLKANYKKKVGVRF